MWVSETTPIRMRSIYPKSSNGFSVFDFRDTKTENDNTPAETHQQFGRVQAQTIAARQRAKSTARIRVVMRLRNSLLRKLRGDPRVHDLLTFVQTCGRE